MNKKPELSLIISYYFQLEIITQTLSEIKNQVNLIKKNIEVLIIDSDTNSRNINIGEFTKNTSFLTVNILQTKNILSTKRNVGFKAAKADYVIFLDDDVIPKPGFIKKFLTISKKNNKMLTSCLVDFENPINSYMYYRKRKENSVRKNFLSRKEINPRFATAMAFGCKRSDIIDNKQYFDEKFIGYGWEDIDYFIEATKKGLKVGISDIYVIHKESDSYKKYFKKQILMGSWYKYFLEKHPKHARKMKIHIIYILNPIFKLILPNIRFIETFLESLIKKDLPFKKFNFFVYEIYFKYANILGMLSDSIKYD
tara:strand:- start:2186 stop:3118 length:933 start_codon:yes stop_codon:yes gene_type:complete